MSANKALLKQLQVALLLAAQRAAEQAQDDDAEVDTDDEIDDPEGYQCFDEASRFLTAFGKGLSGGGDKKDDSIVKDR